jgi:hypothetical protein
MIKNKKEFERMLDFNKGKEFYTKAETLISLTHDYIVEEDIGVLEMAEEWGIKVSKKTLKQLLPLICYDLLNNLINIEVVYQEFGGKMCDVVQQREWIKRTIKTPSGVIN